MHVAAQERKDEGEYDLNVFILNHSKVNTELIDTTWEMKDAALKLFFFASHVLLRPRPHLVPPPPHLDFSCLDLLPSRL